MKRENQVEEEKIKNIIGVDLHPDSFSYAETEKTGAMKLQVRRRVTMAPASSWRDHLQKMIKPAVIVCEASGNSFEFMRIAEEYGFKTCVLDSVDVGKLGNQLCKTDKSDALRIAKIYHIDGAGEVWQPDAETRDLREIGSMYTQVSKDVTRINNRIKSFLTQHGVRLEKGKNDLSRSDVRSIISVKYHWTESDLFLLKEYFSEYDHSLKIKQNLYEFMLKKVNSSLPMRELMKLCGIRVISAFQIVAAIGDIKRFATHKKLVSYFGLAPCIHQSGSKNYSTGIQRDGRRNVRSILVECAKSVLRSKSESAKHLRVWGLKMKNRLGPNVATCALARKIAVAIWYALNGFLPKIVDDEMALKRKLKTVFQEIKLDFIKSLGYATRKNFIDDFSTAILTQKLRR